MSSNGMASSARSEQISFIHILRAAAALIVLWAHLGGWWLYSSNRPSLLQEVWVKFVDVPFHLYQDGGHLGVLIFFLVSGFIITHVSLAETRVEFLLKRVFRIFPTLWLSLIIVAILMQLSLLMGLPAVLGPTVPANAMNLTIHDYVLSATLWNWFIGAPAVLSVVWTLGIEVIFYSLTCLTINLSRRSPILATWLILLVPFTGNIAMQGSASVRILMYMLMYLPFLLVGRAVYLAWSKKASVQSATTVGVASFFLFILAFDNVSPGLLFQVGNEVIISDMIAVILFGALCFSGMKSVPKLIVFVADISYSLYLLHAPVGSFLLNVLVREGAPYALALPITVGALFAICWVVLVVVERPAQRFAKAAVRHLRSKTSPEIKSAIASRVTSRDTAVPVTRP